MPKDTRKRERSDDDREQDANKSKQAKISDAGNESDEGRSSSQSSTGSSLSSSMELSEPAPRDDGASTSSYSNLPANLLEGNVEASRGGSADRAEHSSPSSQTLSGTSSDEELGDRNASDPPIEAYFSLDHNQFQLKIVQSSRPKTNLTSKEGQGDHVTAYITFLEIIYAAIEHEAIKDVPDILCRSAEAFLPTEEHAELAKIIEARVAAIQDSTIPRERRKGITASFRSLNQFNQAIEDSDIKREFFQFLYDKLDKKVVDRFSQALKALDFEEEELEKTKHALKRDYTMKMTSLIIELGKFVIQKINQSSDISFPKSRAKLPLATQNSNLSAGPNEKTSVEALRAFNKLVEILCEGDSHHQDLLIEQFKDNKKLMNGLKTTAGVKRFALDIAKMSNGEIKAIDLNGLTKQAGIFMQGLFDYKVDREMKIDEQIETLFRVSARHIVFIFSAFKHLKKMDVSHKERIVDSYLESVLIYQGWKKVEFFEKSTGKVEQLGLSTFKEKLKRYAVLDFENNKIHVQLRDTEFSIIGAGLDQKLNPSL